MLFISLLTLVREQRSTKEWRGLMGIFWNQSENMKVFNKDISSGIRIRLWENNKSEIF